MRVCSQVMETEREAADVDTMSVRRFLDRHLPTKRRIIL